MPTPANTRFSSIAFSKKGQPQAPAGAGAPPPANLLGALQDAVMRPPSSTTPDAAAQPETTPAAAAETTGLVDPDARAVPGPRMAIVTGSAQQDLAVVNGGSKTAC